MDDYLIETIKRHEGTNPYAYQDSLGYWTIGIGKCIDKRKGRPLTDEEQVYLLKNDLKNCEYQLNPFVFYNELDLVRRQVIIELVFNMGLIGFLGFKKTIEAIKNKDFNKAEHELRDSKWANQVSYERVNNICFRLRYGRYP